MSYTPHKFSTTLALVGAALVLLTLVYGILLKGVRDGERAIRDVEQGIAFLKNGEESARAVAALLQERRRDIGRITAFLIDRESPVSFIETIEGLARTTGNRLELTLNENSRREQELAFIAMVEGTESSVMRYLRLLELLPYAITYDTMRLERVPLGEGVIGHRLTVGFRVRTK